MNAPAVPLLEIEGLRVEFGAPEAPLVAVDDLHLRIERGETLVLVGESGSGKSLTALAVTRLLPAAARIGGGRVRLDGEDLFALPAAAMTAVRGRRIGFVFQEPQVALNPVMRIGDQIGEVMQRHLDLRGAALRARVVEALRAVGIPEPERRAREYPHQYSGGMKQRAMIAIALAGEPDLLIADEPTTALDVTLQAQILELLQAEQRRRGMGMLFITHDFGVAWQVADRVAVLKAGRLVESAPREVFYRAPRHAYSKALFAALPRLERRARPAVSAASPLLEVRDLSVEFPIRKGVFRRIVDRVRAVDGVSLSIAEGETLAVVGESGSGKTTMGRGILRLLPLAGGSVRFRGEDLARLSESALRRRRRHLQIVFQDSYAAMNPRMLVGDIVAEGMVAQGIGGSRAGRAARVAELLAQVGLAPEHAARYPHEFSGGQRQRICIARALAVDPKLIVCDEPTSALDVSVQAQILDLLRYLQQRLGLSFLFITHNLGVVAELAHRVAVMHRGRIVEQGPVDEVLFAPAHEYTRQLLAAVPKIP
ncbi:MAG TPA: ABC transporter ATP-binding protein [Gammaproteobacteria bacterium]|nr:ABC transporter ATP-binding protein [Gammaproteobacteria bacterium]